MIWWGVLVFVVILLWSFWKYLKPSKRVHTTRQVRLTDFQKGVLVELLRNPQTTKYQTSLVIKLNGNLNLSRLRQAAVLTKKYLASFIPSHISRPTAHESTPSSDENVYDSFSHNQVFMSASEFLKKYRPIFSRPFDIECPEIEYFECTSYAEACDEITSRIRTPFDIFHGPLHKGCVVKYGRGEYLLVLYTSHLVSDGRSGLIYGSYLQQFYNNPRVFTWYNEWFPLRSIGEYVGWRDKNYGIRMRETDVEYWTKKLSGSSFHFDFFVPRSQQVSLDENDFSKDEGKRVYFSLDETACGRINEFVKRTKTTTFIVMMALFSSFLRRIFGHDDFVIAYPCNIRPKSFRYTPGYLINQLLLRVKVSSSVTLEGLVKQIAKDRWEDRKRMNCSFFELVKALRKKNPNFDPSLINLSLMSTVFNLDVKFDKCVSEKIVFQEYGESQTDLCLLYQENPKEGGISCAFEYKTSVFSEIRIENLKSSFQVFIEHVLQNWSCKVTDAHVLTDVDFDTQIFRWNRTKKEYPFSNLTIPDLFEEMVARNEQNCCVEFEDARKSYLELNNKSNQFANLFRERKFQKEFVGVCLDKGIELIEVILGIVKSENVYFPFKCEFPDERLKFMMHATACRVVVVHEKHETRMKSLLSSSSDAEILVIEKLDVSSLSTENLSSKRKSLDPNDPSYVIFTSGTTGLPKPVIVSHFNVVNYTRSYYDLIDSLKSVETFGFFASIVFDISISDIFTPILNGKKLVIIPENIRLNGEKLVEFIDNSKINVINLPPTVLGHLDPVSENLENLTHLFVGGETCSYKIMKKWSQKVEFFGNIYGPTEATCWSHVKMWKSSDLATNIGKPLKNYTCLILNEDLKPLPVGFVGTLFIGGVGVSNGYLNNEVLTSEKFVNDPFRTGEKLYCTGDLCCFQSNGDVVFEGRGDSQVKINGNRIELSSIENVVKSVENVIDCVCVVESRDHGKRIVCFVRVEEEFQQVEVTRKLRKTFPKYMIPSNIFVVVEKFPLTISGKIDRVRLIELENKSMMESQVMVFPSNDVERIVHGMWSSVFNNDHISVTSDFFEMGGHSLMATSLVSKLRIHFGVDIGLSEFFRNPSVRAVSQLVDEKKDSEKGASRFIFSRRENGSLADEPFDSTLVQQAYLFGRNKKLFGKLIGTHVYYEVDLFRDLDVSKMERAINYLIERHEMLRCVFVNNLRQRILSVEDVGHYTLEFSDFSKLKNDDFTTSELSSLRENNSHKVFDPTKFPLFSFKLCKLRDRHFRILINLDMLTLDGLSQMIILKELSVLYHSNHDTRVVLEPLDINFRDCLTAMEVLKKNGYEKSKKYWEDKIANGMTIGSKLPIKTSVSCSSGKFRRVAATISSDTWSVVKKKCERLRLSKTCVVLAVFSRVIGKWSSSSCDPLLMNLTLFNRPSFHTNVNRVVGDFTTIELFEYVPKSVRGLKFVSEVRAVQKCLFDDLDHQAFSGIEVTRKLQKSDTVVAPVVLTSMLNVVTSELDNFLEENDAKLVFGITQTSQVFLDHKVYELNNEFVSEIDYLEDVFCSGVVEDIHNAFTETMERLASVEWNSFELDVELSKDTRVVLNDFNNTDVENNSGNFRFLHEGFIRNVEKAASREMIAVSSHRKELSYTLLYNYTSFYENRIRSLKIERENIAVVMEKGWEEIVSVLSILLSRNAYVPINPNQPSERIVKMLSLADCKIVCTTTQLSFLASDITQILIREVEDENDFVQLSPKEIGPDVDPSDLAYIIFTSGSSGAPKGVKISHKNAMNTINDINDRFNVMQNDKVLAISQLSFDLSVWDIFGALSVGATLVIPCNDEILDARKLWMYLRDYEITIWNSVPQFCEVLTSVSEIRELQATKIRLVMMSGDWIPVKLPEKLKKMFPESSIISLGGATEGSIWSIIYDISDPKLCSRMTSIPYGSPLSNQKMFILSEDNCECPIHVEGEICIGGKSVAVGYLDEHQTKRSFFFHPKLNERLYRTGDIGKMLPDGNMQILGRKDRMVKLRGYRIELKEIENALNSLHFVRQSVVKKCSESLVGFVVGAFVDKREMFEAKQRRFNTESAICDDMKWKKENLLAVFARKSYRHFSETFVIGQTEFENLFTQHDLKTPENFLSALESFQCWFGGGDDVPFPKFVYPSAGGLYPVHTYVTKMGESGVYEYNPCTNCLEIVSDSVLGEKKSKNYVHFVGEISDVQRFYPENFIEYCELEIGFMSYFLNGHLARRVSVPKKIMPNITRISEHKYRYFWSYEIEKTVRAKLSLNVFSKSNVKVYLVVKSNSIEGFSSGIYEFLDDSFCFVCEKEVQDGISIGLFPRSTIESCSAVLVFVNCGVEVTPNLELVGNVMQMVMMNCADCGIGTCLLGEFCTDSEFQVTFSGNVIACLAIGGVSNDELGNRGIVKSQKGEMSMLSTQYLRVKMSRLLPPYMVPRKYILLEKFPLSSNGKIDHNFLETLTVETQSKRKKPSNEIESKIANHFKEIIQVDEIGIDDNIFELGINSLMLIKIYNSFPREYREVLSIGDIFSCNTIEKISQFVAEKTLNGRNPNLELFESRGESDDFAIVGMSVNFPGCSTLDEFWENIVKMKVCKSSGDSEMPYPLTNMKGFDHSFFNLSKSLCDIIDPQFRIFLQDCYHCLEDAGIDRKRFTGKIGLFCGVSESPYFSIVDDFKTLISENEMLYYFNSSHIFSGWISYTLGIKGNSISVNGACASSLSTLDIACKAISQGDCDMALVGGISLVNLNDLGYLNNSGMMSDDGFTRTFDSKANGTTFGQGSGVVIICSKEYALQNNYRMYSVIKGIYSSNDGRETDRPNVMAPSSNGQSAVIEESLKRSNCHPDTIQYIESHGTGTKLGDVVEITSLKRVFLKYTDRKQYIHIGALKPCIGHSYCAAGIGGVIKASLCLSKRVLPGVPLLEKVNPLLEIENSPFVISSETKRWENVHDHPRRAGVSSFGLAGNSVHAILEEPPEQSKREIGDQEFFPLLFSANSLNSMEMIMKNTVNFLGQQENLELCDLAYTLFKREKMLFRKFLVVSRLDNIESLIHEEKIIKGTSKTREICFVFTGMGSQHQNMAIDLYGSDQYFTENVDLGLAFCASELEVNLYSFFKEKKQVEEEHLPILLYIVEYSLAHTLHHFGVSPSILVGHSFGEYAVHAFAGTYSYEDGLRIISRRCELLKEVEKGSMIAVKMSESEINDIVAGVVDKSPEEVLELALVNGPTSVVVSGTVEAVSKLKGVIEDRNVTCKVIRSSHAFHCSLLDPILSKFGDFLDSISFKKPKVKVVSACGEHSSDIEIFERQYWVDHMRKSVNFSRVMDLLLPKSPIFVEIGPGNSMTRLLRENSVGNEVNLDTVCTLSHPRAQENDCQRFVKCLAKLWSLGVEVNWDDFFARCQPRLVRGFPKYPFDTVECWINESLFHEDEPEKVVGSDIVEDSLSFIGQQQNLPVKTFVKTLRLDSYDWIQHHKVKGSVLFPASGMIEMFFQFMKVKCIRDFSIKKAVPILSKTDLSIVERDETIQLYAKQFGGTWDLTCFVSKKGETQGSKSRKYHDSISDIKKRCKFGYLSHQSFYQKASLLKYDYSGPFKKVQSCFVGIGECLCEIVVDDEIFENENWVLHPTVLDLCLQSSLGLVENLSQTFLPTYIREISIF